MDAVGQGRAGEAAEVQAAVDQTAIGAASMRNAVNSSNPLAPTKARRDRGAEHDACDVGAWDVVSPEDSIRTRRAGKGVAQIGQTRRRSTSGRRMRMALPQPTQVVTTGSMAVVSRINGSE